MIVYFKETATTEIYTYRHTLALHDARPIVVVDWSHAELADADAGRDARIDVQPGLQAWGDERQLRLLVTQLLRNAWKFSRDRDRVHVEVDGERHGDRLVMHVRDHGSGFDIRYAATLFDPFQRPPGPEPAVGTGPGLALLRRHAH